MTFEVGEVDHEVVVLEVRTYNVVVQVSTIGHGNLEFPFFVHKVYLECGKESMFLDGFPMGFGGVAASFVSSVTFYDGATHLIYELADEFGFQIVGVTAFAGGDLYGNAAFGGAAQSVIDVYQCFGRNLAREINDRFFFLIGRSAWSRLVAAAATC